MPPWKAEVGHARFLGERRLTDAQIALIDRWAKAGAPEGNAADKPPLPQYASGWRLGKPDLELVAPDSFTVAADGEDVFQHWIIPLDLPEDKIVVGFEFRPGNPAVVHHAILFLDTSGMGRKKDAETPEPGYTTFGSIGIPTAGIIGVWTPGMTPRFYPQERRHGRAQREPSWCCNCTCIPPARKSPTVVGRALLRRQTGRTQDVAFAVCRRFDHDRHSRRARTST